MSNPRVLLARCAARGGSYSIGTGGPEFTPADVAYAVGRIKHPAGQALVLYLWAGHAESGRALRTELTVEVGRLATDRGWRITRPGTLGGLIRLAVNELRQPRHCPRCNSTGERAGKPCERCDGEGTLPYTERAQAFVSGLSRRALREYAGWYDEIFHLIKGFEQDAISDMKHALT